MSEGMKHTAPVNNEGRLYAKRDIEGDELRPHYMRHLDHMTREGHGRGTVQAE